MLILGIIFLAALGFYATDHPICGTVALVIAFLGLVGAIL